MSEYDFAEEPDEIPEPADIMHVNKKYFTLSSRSLIHDDFQNLAIQKMDPNLLMVLNSFQLEDEILERFAGSGIKFSQLAGLINEDLAMLGINDEKLQEEMLRDFRNLEGQEPYLELWVAFSAQSNHKIILLDFVVRCVISVIRPKLQNMKCLWSI